MDLGRANGKKLLLHADLIEGLKTTSMRLNFCAKAFVLPESFLHGERSSRKPNRMGLSPFSGFFSWIAAHLKSYTLLERTQPDYIEVLPGIIPHIIKEVKERSGIPILQEDLFVL